MCLGTARQEDTAAWLPTVGDPKPNGPNSNRKGQGFAPTTMSSPNASMVFGENRKQSQISGKHKETVGLGLTLVVEPCGKGDLCPSGGSLPTGCRQAVNVTYDEKIFPMSYFYANYLNVFRKENTKYPTMREY